MRKDGVAAELATDGRLDHQSIGLALLDAVFGDVVLHVILVVVFVLWVVETAAARRFQIVDPGQVMLVDEIGVEAKSGDDRFAPTAGQSMR